MRIAVVAPSPVPFAVGGAERLFDGLTLAINSLTDHTAELVKLPLHEQSFSEIIDSYQRFSELDVSDFDIVIATKYPSWMVENPNKVLYLLHTLRGLYDTYHFASEPDAVVDPPREISGLLTALDALTAGTGQAREVFESAHGAASRLGWDHPVFRFPGPLIRRVVHALDTAALMPPNTRRHFSISRTVADRDYFPAGVTSGVAYPPSNLTGFHEGRSEHFFTASRLDAPKRIGLIIEAFLQTDLALPLKIAGTGNDMERLVELAGNDPRIQFLGRVSDDELVELYADALAVPFVPYDEDLGYITLESMHCGTPVITCSDSGGPTEFVHHGINGLIAEPDPASLAAAFENVGRDPDRARAMAPAALHTARSVTWEGVVNSLLNEPTDLAGRRTSPPTTGASVEPPTAAVLHDRPHVLVLSTYPFFPSDSGGRIRGARLIAGLSDSFDVEIVAPARKDESGGISTPIPGVTQRMVRLPDSLYRLEQDWTEAVEWTPISDIAPGLMLGDAPAFLEAVHGAARGAAAVVLSHSYLVEALDTVPGATPVILDAVDLEVVQKQRVLPNTDAGVILKRSVEVLERSATARADLITICSPDDAAEMAGCYTPRAPIEVVPNGTDVDTIDFVSHIQRVAGSRRWLDRFNGANDSEFRSMALYIASWHPPNIEAARSILDMAREARNTVFVLAGAHSRYFDEWQIPPNVVLAGFVSDSVKQGLLSAATVALNPMAAGSGTNLKILEYWAAGIPTISTLFGVRGIDAVADEHYLEAPLSEFPEAIASVAASPATLAPMTEAARRLVESTYDWNVIGADFRRLVEYLLARSSEDVRPGVRNGT